MSSATRGLWGVNTIPFWGVPQAGHYDTDINLQGHKFSHWLQHQWMTCASRGLMAGHCPWPAHLPGGLFFDDCGLYLSLFVFRLLIFYLLLASSHFPVSSRPELSPHPCSVSKSCIFHCLSISHWTSPVWFYPVLYTVLHHLFYVGHMPFQMSLSEVVE